MFLFLFYLIMDCFHYYFQMRRVCKEIHIPDANPLCKVVYYMNHTTGLCGSYSTQLYTTLHSFTQRFVVHVNTVYIQSRNYQ